MEKVALAWFAASDVPLLGMAVNPVEMTIASVAACQLFNVVSLMLSQQFHYSTQTEMLQRIEHVIHSPVKRRSGLAVDEHAGQCRQRGR